MKNSILIPNNMTMAEIERYCKAKAKRREAETATRNAELDKNQKMMDNALARLKKIICLLLLVASVSANAAHLEMKVMKQKSLPNGRPYGLAAGIYFEIKDMEPDVMYKIEYSTDLKKWTRIVQVTTWYNSMTSPYWTW
ncbi:uncharacterized protein METZ01_LOCUS411749, partial [marine metagenome]